MQEFLLWLENALSKVNDVLADYILVILLISVGLFYTINYPKDYFEKSVRPHLKQSEDVLKMLNGKVFSKSLANCFSFDLMESSSLLA